VKKTAVFLLNLGGPDSLEAVQPFLFNLFYDPLIISLPNPLRYGLAKLISHRRTHEAQEIYSHMGGKSPILENTQKQCAALQKLLPETLKVFPVMRYWHPRAQDVIQEALTWGAEDIMCLPLYPQYSTTTTESSYKEIQALLRDKGFSGALRLACCYPEDPLWISGVVHETQKALEKAASLGPYRLVFSAHGLPEKVIKGGDPYEKQVENTVSKVVEKLGLPSLDWILAYQSRVGPLKWIGPSTEDEVVRAAHEGMGIIVVPIAFVSEHSETLVELDIQYRDLALKEGAAFYKRVPTVADHPDFIRALKNLLEKLLRTQSRVLCPLEGACSGQFKKCGGRLGRLSS
jgi:ferrochelatase